MCLIKISCRFAESSGQIYLPAKDEDYEKIDTYNKVIKHTASQVTITGKVANKNGVQALVVEDVKTGS